MERHYQIRLAKPHELELLHEIEVAASKLFEQTRFALEATQETLSLELLQSQQKQSLVWVASNTQDCPVGFAVVIILENYAHLHEVSVDPAHGRRGLGTKLVNQVIEFAQISGLSGVTLSTFRDIPWNAPFYRKLGFRVMSHEAAGASLEVIRNKEQAAGLPISERVLMLRICE